MRSNLLVAATAIIFGLIGWQAASLQQTKVKHQGQKCASNDCKVTVLVESFCLSCDVSVDFEMTEAKGYNINFEIDKDSAPRYEFSDRGISFDSGFSCQKNGKKFSCTNTNPTTPGVYKYTVNVIDTRYGNKPLDPLDPWVVN